MGEIIDLEEYRQKTAQEEVDRLRTELDEVLSDFKEISPQPYYPATTYPDTLSDFSSLYSPLGGSLGGFCPMCSSLGILGPEDKNDGS
jgi:hypothetical protein